MIRALNGEVLGVSGRRNGIKNRSGKHALMRPVQGDICPLCNKPLPPRVRGQKAATNLDHVYPLRFKRGTTGNLLVTHTTCNLQKSDRYPTGCEIIMLTAVNAVCGWNGMPTRKAWRRAWRQAHPAKGARS